MDKPFQELTHALGADCQAAGIIDASWEARSFENSSVINRSYFNFNYPTPLTLLDGAPLGLWNFVPTGARGAGDISLQSRQKSTPTTGVAPAQATVSIPQNSPSMDVRLRTYAQLTGWTPNAACTRMDWKVNATRYAAKWNGNVANTGATGRIEYQPTDAAPISLGSFTTDSAGNAVVKAGLYYGPGKYRVWVNATFNMWASSSAWKTVTTPSPCV